jgi:hypothetical protein
MKKTQFISSRFQLACAVVASLATCHMANATLTYIGSIGGATAGANLVNFDDLTPGSSSTATATGPSGSVLVSFTPDGQVAEGSQSGVYAAPYLSGLNGLGFNNPGVPGPDLTPFLTTGMGTVTLSFSSPENYFGILWGSVDPYNTLSFYGANGLIQSLTGTQVLAGANGNQGVNGTIYENIWSSVPYTSVVATSSQYAFEFDNVAYSAVPEPTTIIAGALLLLPFGASTIQVVKRRTA